MDEIVLDGNDGQGGAGRAGRYEDVTVLAGLAWLEKRNQVAQVPLVRRTIACRSIDRKGLSLFR